MTDTNMIVVNMSTILFFIVVIWILYDRLVLQHPQTSLSIHEGFQENNATIRTGVPDEVFAQQATSEIITEMAKQLDTLDAADRHLARDQLGHYVPHPDIIQQYRETTENMLDGLKKQVDVHTQEKRKQLDRLNTYLLNLQEFVEADFLDRQRQLKASAIKSHNNGQELALIPVSSTTNQGQLRSGKYRVRVNGGCIRVSENNNYDVVPLDMNDQEQIFHLEMIYNETGYRNSLAKGFPQVSNLGDVRYPFALLRASSNGNCLNNKHGRLSVEPCREHEGQRWAVLEESTLPKCM